MTFHFRAGLMDDKSQLLQALIGGDESGLPWGALPPQDVCVDLALDGTGPQTPRKAGLRLRREFPIASGKDRVIVWAFLIRYAVDVCDDPKSPSRRRAPARVRVEGRLG